MQLLMLIVIIYGHLNGWFHNFGLRDCLLCFKTGLVANKLVILASTIY